MLAQARGLWVADHGAPGALNRAERATSPERSPETMAKRLTILPCTFDEILTSRVPWLSSTPIVS